jgi:DNA repair exonuclease SbcCD ATPase subunit
MADKSDAEAKSQSQAHDEPTSVVVPVGMTRAEFKDWKAAQTEDAKSRLRELESRLQRLQQLEGKMTRLKTSADEAVDAVPDHWTLPGTVDDGFDGSAWPPRSAPFAFC